jgi:N-acetyl-alpha-D-glucosaminyl L-malate synthase BshA
MLLSEGIKIPIITTLHGTDIHTIGKKKDFRSIIKFSLDNSDGIVAVSKFLEKQAREIGVNSDIKVIYNYVDTEKFKREISKETKKLKAEFVSKNEKLILHVSNFREIKRVEDIIRAFNKIKRKVPSRLVLVGSGPRIGVIRELISRLKLKKRVFLVGKQKKPEKYYSIADLFMLASEREACPLSILEAMSSGVPVVASNVGGVPEIVVEGKTGYLVDKGDVVDMAKKSIKILCDRRKLKEMREFSRKEVLEKYSKTKIIKEYEDYFLKNI